MLSDISKIKSLNRLTKTQLKKKLHGKCITPYCMKKAQYAKGNKSNYCCSCRTNIWRKNNPIKYAYKVLKNNAHKRHKTFTLTFDYFKKLVEKNDYMNKKGCKAKSLQIDRKKEHLGYSDDNVQCITLRENRYKYDKSKGYNVSEVAPF